MRLLLIAPDQPGISWAREIEAMTDGHHAVVLTGDVSEERILNRTAGEKFDILHFVAHADDSGIDMVSWQMTPKDVAQLARHIRAELVFLNVCRSLYLPQYLIDQHVPAVLSHTRQEGIADKSALKLAAYFYEELVRQNGNMHKAYQIASPHDGTLAWSSNGAFVGTLEPIISRSEQNGLLINRNSKAIKWLTLFLALGAAAMVAQTIVIFFLLS